MSLSRTRLATARKAQFVPTWDPAVVLIGNEVKFTYKTLSRNIADLSCGEGTALAALGKMWDAVTWGNELEKNRHKEASKVLDHCTLGPQESLEVTGKFDAIFLNPPYDMGEENRYEIEHPEQCGKWLKPNGLMILVIPLKILKMRDFWEAWLSWYETPIVRRMPEPEFSKWHQVVLFGRARGYKRHYVDVGVSLMTDEYQEVLGQSPVNIEFTPQDHYWSLNKQSVSKMENCLPAAVDIIEALGTMPPWDQTSEWRTLMRAPVNITGGAPAMPSRVGHAIQEACAGMVTGYEMEMNSRRYILSGMDYKATHVVEIKQKGGSDTHIIEKPAYRIYGLCMDDGHFFKVDSDSTPQKYEEFAKEHVGDLVKAVDNGCPPAYTMDYSNLVSHFAQIHGPRDLPGRETNGLFTGQKHAAAAMLKVLEQYPGCILVGECGTGKTVTSMGTMAIQSCMIRMKHEPKHARIVVFAPAGVSRKWVEEAETALRDIPNFKAVLIGDETRRIHYTPTRDNPSSVDWKYLTTKVDRERQRQRRNLSSEDVLTAEELRRYEIYRHHRQWFATERPARTLIKKPILDTIAAFEYNGPILMVVPYEIGKMGSPWEYRLPYETKMMEWIKITTGKDDNGKKVTTEKKVKELAKVYRCPECHYRLVDKKTNKPWNEEELNGKVMQNCPECGQPLWTCVPFKKGGRWPVCEFINKHYANDYYLIVDELHNTKSGDTDIGAASQDLISGARKIIAMTGTVFNGMAESLFYLFYRISPVFRRYYKHNECANFVQDHGYVETIIRLREQRTSSYSGYSKTTETTQIKAAPGVDPQVVAMMLPFTVFLRKTDLGIDLPPKMEYAVPVKMTTQQFGGYATLASMEGFAKRQFMDGNRAPLALLNSATMGWPDKPEMEKIKGLCELPNCMPKEGLLPKDEMTINQVIEDLNHGRGVVIHFAQVNRRDIRPRVSAALRERGILHTVMDKDDAGTLDRMDWLIRHCIQPAQAAGQPPVLLANMGLLKEGVDMCQFASMIFTAPMFNINTLSQIVDRLHRLGQTRPVNMYFMFYEKTRQEFAIKWVASKLRAASALNGERAAGLGTYEMDEAEFVQALMCAAGDLDRTDVSELMQIKVAADVELKIHRPKPQAVEVLQRAEDNMRVVSIPLGGGIQQLSFF